MNALPSPEPNRRKRPALRFAALVAAVSAMGAAYWFTRPPELVWWRSNPIDDAGHRVKVFVPGDWREHQPSPRRFYSGMGNGLWTELISRIEPSDTRPEFLHRVLQTSLEEGGTEI